MSDICRVDLSRAPGLIEALTGPKICTECGHKICPQCGGVNLSKRKYCSGRCFDAAKAAPQVGRPTTTLHVCPQCGWEFDGKSTRVYCSTKCRARAQSDAHAKSYAARHPRPAPSLLNDFSTPTLTCDQKWDACCALALGGYTALDVAAHLGLPAEPVIVLAHAEERLIAAIARGYSVELFRQNALGRWQG